MAYKCTAPAFFNVDAQADIVDPVVSTSSTITIDIFSIFPCALKASAIFALRSSLFNVVCETVKRLRLETVL